MTPEEKVELKAWAEAWYKGIFLVQGRQVLELLAENEELQGEAERLSDVLECQFGVVGVVARHVGPLKPMPYPIEESQS
jgi:hypothetical protein